MRTIQDFLACGDDIGSHRTPATAKKLLNDFKSQLAAYTSRPEFQEKLATEYIEQVILSAAWYTQNIRKARILRNLYVVVYVVLLVGIPGLIFWLGNQLATRTAAPQSGLPPVTQVVLGLTAVVALQQMGNVIMAAHQRFGIWWKTASGLKTIWYTTLSTWGDATADTAGKSTVDFMLDLKTSIAKARALVSDEQQDFFDNLAKPFPDILNILSSTTKAVKGMVTDVLPDAEAAGVNAAAAIKARREIARQEAIAEQLDVMIDSARIRVQQAVAGDARTAAEQELGRWIAQKEVAVKARMAAVGDLAAAAS